MEACYTSGPNNFLPTHQPPKQRRSSKSPHPKTRTQEGWHLQWTYPKSQNDVIRAVVPGPFLQPRLLKATPYVVLSSCRYCASKNDPLGKLRTGIPDPWLEYLAWKESRLPGHVAAGRDVRLEPEYVRLTDFVWNEKGLPMLQGIPDPWKVDTQLACDPDCERKKQKKKKEKKKTFKDKAVVVEPNAGHGEAPKKKKSEARKRDKPADKEEEVGDKPREKPKCNGFERVRRKLSKLEDELKVRYAEKEERLREMEELARLRKKDAKRRNKKDKARRKEGSRERPRKESKKPSDFPKEEEESRNRAACLGRCGRVCPRRARNDHEPINEPCGCEDRRDVEKMLERINDRIQVTSDALDSVTLPEGKEAYRRERGAGDTEEMAFFRKRGGLLALGKVEDEREAYRSRADNDDVCHGESVLLESLTE